MNDCRFFVLNFKVSFKRYQTLNWPFSLLSIIIRQPEKRSEYQTLVLNDRPFGNALAVSFFRRCGRLRLCAYDFQCSIQKTRGKLGLVMNSISQFLMVVIQRNQLICYTTSNTPFWHFLCKYWTIIILGVQIKKNSFQRHTTPTKMIRFQKFLNC